MQQTLVLVKPDGVKKNLIGEIIARFERRGLKVSALKLVKITEEQAKYHYAEHEGKPFCGELVEFMTSGLLQQWLFPVRMQLKRFVARWVLLIR